MFEDDLFKTRTRAIMGGGVLPNGNTIWYLSEGALPWPDDVFWGTQKVITQGLCSLGGGIYLPMYSAVNDDVVPNIAEFFNPWVM